MQAENEVRDEPSAPAPAPRSLGVFDSMGSLGSPKLLLNGHAEDDEPDDSYEDGYISQAMVHSLRSPTELDNSASLGRDGKDLGSAAFSPAVSPLPNPNNDLTAPVPLDDNDYESFFKGDLPEGALP